ncbi:P27 family phage terminase small subunit [Rhodovulum sp. DZ06]|uniref:P27 family phage terminase small subunit n=1 Tax=Rhodovulum sp. DZ06 TaxID=3425126 RepID=UPI003D357891
MAGRPPKLDGKKAREGARGLEMESIGGAEAIPRPKNLGHYGRVAWEAATRSLGPARVLSHGDLLALEACCRAWGRWRRLEAKIDEIERRRELAGELSRTPNGHVQMSALRISADRALKQFSALAREFGLTPVARIKTAGTAQGDLFADLEPKRPARGETDPTDPFAPDRVH